MCESEILQVAVIRILVFSTFYVDFRRFSAEVQKIAKKGYLGFMPMFIKTDKLSINITIQS